MSLLKKIVIIRNNFRPCLLFNRSTRVEERRKLPLRNWNKGLTLIEIVLVLAIMMLMLAMVVPSKKGIQSDLLLYQTTVEIENALKLARHLSVDESTTYRVDIYDQTLSIRRYLHDTTPVFTMEIPEEIKVRVTTPNVIFFNRNGGSSYHRILIKNQMDSQFIIQTAIGSGRIYISR